MGATTPSTAAIQTGSQRRGLKASRATSRSAAHRRQRSKGSSTVSKRLDTGIDVWNAVNENEGPNDEGEAGLKAKEAERESCGNPATSPGSKFEWKGKGPMGSSEGSWWDPDTDESLYPHLGENSHGPHYDYEGPSGNYRIYPGGRIEAKP
jgi:Bacterial toxin 37